MMPDESGVEVLPAVRKRFSATDLPVIMATAKSQSDDMVEAFRAGASDYVTNPQHGSALTQPIPGTDRVLVTPPAEVAATLTAKFPFDPRTEKFFTMFFGQFNVRTRELRYVSAGSPSPVLLRDGQSPALLVSDGLPIGIADIAYDERTIAPQPGDRLFLYSDGVSEAMSPSGDVFGMNRLIEALQRATPCSLDDQVTELTNSLSDWRSPGRANDDITLLAFEVCR